MPHSLPEAHFESEKIDCTLLEDHNKEETKFEPSTHDEDELEQVCDENKLRIVINNQTWHNSRPGVLIEAS